MVVKRSILNHVVAAFLLIFAGTPGWASQASSSAEVLELLEELRKPELERWQRVERQIARLWSRSGSASADLLLARGQDSLRRGDSGAAIDHFSALIDHAPDFAEGYHARATAWFMAGDLGLALDDLVETLARNPQHFSALAGLGRIFEDLSQLEYAREAYRASAAIHPHRTDVNDALERVERQLTGTEL